MKTFFALFVLAAATMFTSAGCSTPAYSGHERWQMISRNWNFEGAQIQDDVDHILLLRPASRLTIWHIR